MALHQYITTADIKGTVFQDFSLSGVVEDTNDHLEALALSLDCNTEDIAFPVNPLVKEYLVDYASRQCALLKIGTNNVELTQDKYIVIHSVYNKEVERLRAYISYAVITDEVDEASETSRTSTVYRG